MPSKHTALLPREHIKPEQGHVWEELSRVGQGSPLSSRPAVICRPERRQLLWQAARAHAVWAQGREESGKEGPDLYVNKATKVSFIYLEPPWSDAKNLRLISSACGSRQLTRRVQ